MPRCADERCQRWRPDLTSLERVAGTSVRKLGALQFNGQWYCSPACVEQAARAGLDEQAPSAVGSKGLPPLKLGVLLRHAGAISQADLEAALGAARASGLRIGEQLVRLGLTSQDEILRALAAQAGVSYFTTFDIARVERGPGMLPPAMVRALGLVPFEADDVLQRLSVVCAAPVPRAAMRALVRLTGWVPEVYLVSDAVFQMALEAYRPAAKATQLHHAMTVRNVGAAAAHVAELAVSERAVTMRHAQCQEYRWVRVQGAQRVSDLLVLPLQEEARCQAELIAH
jgi:hypothetical protein